MTLREQGIAKIPEILTGDAGTLTLVCLSECYRQPFGLFWIPFEFIPGNQAFRFDLVSQVAAKWL